MPIEFKFYLSPGSQVRVTSVENSEMQSQHSEFQIVSLPKSNYRLAFYYIN